MIIIKQGVSLFITVFIGIIFMGSSTEAAMPGTAGKGAVISVYQLPAKGIVPINGKWEFYWHKFYSPNDFKQNHVLKTRQLVEVPQTWSRYKQERENLPQTGYATYRIQVEFPESEVGTTQFLYMPSVASAYTLWINGKKKSENGEVGKSRDTMKPESIPKVVEFRVHSKRVEFIIQASNFNQRKAGITEPLLIGEPKKIFEYREKKLIYRVMIVMSLVIMGLYHIALFAFRRKEPALIFFGIVCITVSIRAILLEEDLASYILSFLDWEAARKLEYLGASLGTLFISLFSYIQFSEEMDRRMRNVIMAVMSTYSLFIVLAPALVFTRTMILLQAFIMLTFLYLLYVDIKALLHKREGSFLNMAAIFMMFLAVVNDTLYFNKVVHTTELASVGLLFFLFTQSIILSKRYSMSFIRSENLSRDLAVLNASLEQQVQKRTVELEQVNNELQNVNEKLIEAHLSRSKWIRNIIHEISSPLTGIRAYTKGMLDDMITSDKKNIQLVYDQSLNLSQLLDDLRDMTEMENNQIKFDMHPVNIQIYIRQIYEKYKWEIEKNGITFERKDLLTQREHGCIVLMDTMRIEQVIINLLKNAQRFVKEEGKISLELGKSDDNHIVIKVRDNGTGINEDELNLIFSRFYRGRKQGKPHSGSGLGLAISKEIIEYHHGKLSVESKSGFCSCFYFTLPILTK